MDFHQADPKDKLKNAISGQDDPDVVWAKTLIDQLQKDRVLKSCDW
jgi:hypothetical protein